jgi:hypothetical protein
VIFRNLNFKIPSWQNISDMLNSTSVHHNSSAIWVAFCRLLNLGNVLQHVIQYRIVCSPGTLLCVSLLPLLIISAWIILARFFFTTLTSEVKNFKFLFFLFSFWKKNFFPIHRLSVVSLPLHDTGINDSSTGWGYLTIFSYFQ